MSVFGKLLCVINILPLKSSIFILYIGKHLNIYVYIIIYIIKYAALLYITSLTLSCSLFFFINYSIYQNFKSHPTPIGPVECRLWMYAEYVRTTLSGNKESSVTSYKSSTEKTWFPNIQTQQSHLWVCEKNHDSISYYPSS